MAYAEVLPDEKATTAIAFLRRAIAFYKRHGITVERLLTDNGSAHRSSVHARAAGRSVSATSAPDLTAPRPTARIERFIRTMLGSWAYGAIHRDSRDRTAALDGWL